MAVRPDAESALTQQSDLCLDGNTVLKTEGYLVVRLLRKFRFKVP